MNNILWLPYSLSAILAFFGFISRPLKRTKTKHPVDIVITTIGTENVSDAVINTIKQVGQLDNDGRIWVLTEPHCHHSLINYCSGINSNVNLIIVPPSWDKGRFKGRAIWWFSRKIVKNDTWYMFLDDDSYPMDDKFTYEIDECEKQHRYVGNCRLVSRGGGKIPRLCDNLRTTDDMTIFRLTLQGFKRPLIGLHGEGLIVKGHILRKYWNDIHSIVEDAEFGCHVNGNVKTFQSSTEISILSPLTIRDFWKQRRRWFLGLWSIFPNFSTLGQIILGLRMIAWSMGWICVSVWATMFLWWDFEGNHVHEHYYIRVVSLVGFILLLIYYGIGAKHTKTLRMMPLYFFPCVFVEAVIPLYSFLTRHKVKGFDVIDKTERKLEDVKLRVDRAV